MKIHTQFKIGSRVVELRLETAASHALLWLIVLSIFWFLKAGRITYHRLRIKLLRMRFRKRYFQDSAVIQKQRWKRYNYQPLQGPGSRQIRLLELQSNGSIRIRTSSLAGSDIPEYEALSYCWGNDTELYRVDVLVHDGDEEEEENVEHLWVSRGLRVALERLTIKGCVRILWIDAICINQKDLNEKSWQVSMMTDIYKSASRVVVYLDIPGGFENSIGDIIPRLVRTKHTLDVSPYSEIAWDDFDRHKELQKLSNPPGFREIETASLYLFENPWFWRVWVIQEISLAQDAMVICEGWELPWQSLSNAYDWIGKSMHWTYRGGNTRLSLLEVSRANRTREDLATLLLRHRGTFASDPRDHIFALLGLAQDGDQLTVDYGKSPSDILIETAKHILLTQENLGFLAAAGMSQRTESELPSWVPDMRTKAAQKPFSDFYTRPSGKIAITCSETGLSLVCSKIGCVTMLGDIAPQLPRDPARKSFIETRAYSTLFSWRRITKTSSIDLYAMGCVTQAGLVWPCSSDTERHDQYKEGNQSCFDVQLGFHFLASLLPIPQSFLIAWDAVYVLSLVLQLFLMIYYRLRKRYFMRILSSDVCFGRRLIGTDNGYLGLAPSDTNIGDEIFLLKGISMLIVVRKKNEGFSFVGEGYLGNYRRQNAGADRDWQTITLC